jgi:hypothetical protein
MAFIETHRLPLTMTEARDALDNLRVDNVLHGFEWGATHPTAGRLVLSSDPYDRPYLPQHVGRAVVGALVVGRRTVRVEVEVLPFSSRESEIVVRVTGGNERLSRYLEANARAVRSIVEAFACSIVGAAAQLVETRRELATTSV